MHKSYKYRIYPTKIQQEFLDKQFGMCRFVYNYCLGLQIKNYQETKTSLSKYTLQNKITQLKQNENTIWLQEGMSQALCRETENLDKAFTSFFKKNAKFPKFKSKHKDSKSFTIPQGFKILNNKLILPKIKGVKIKLHRIIPSTHLTSCTISKTSTNKYYASINFQVNEIIPELKPIVENQAIGLDIGIKAFATLSDNTIIENPKFLRKSLKQLKRLSRQHSKKKQGSNNKEKSRLKLAKVHEKIKNQREDFLHQTTAKLTDTYDTICLETLKAKNMIKNHKLALSLSDIAIGKFNEFIEYKAKNKGVNILRIGQFCPSSKMCQCGVINKELTLKDRTWTCKSCNVTHDRDVLAANNIKRFAFAKIQQT